MSYKFRAWNKEKGLMIEPSGFYSDTQEDVFIFMQFTGALDKNGKEVYSGDIVKLPIQNEFGSLFGEIGKVIRWAEGARFTIINTKESNSHLDIDDSVSKLIEVVGNIYENPNLLQK